ncbi:GspE/PulE family protein [Psychrobium sp. 1_MG-2023]|uniref:GspE/PulE family protein n=1 Tax=Psychrobium sp. 1_MG-2023 TaxID=3062624 RepID=UPI000C32F89D|nr:GspE/PulE family protein [Psychrobium sp. 1_MG-2023]MDP2561784.1 GspE/PulE family protein [Psychrobium sp. 1_MG-2023]PKF59732.1 type II/IV secretion system protein [Alteromonadales bacterium alter-6D02]
MALTDEKLLEAALYYGLIEASVIDNLRTTARRQRSSVIELVLAHYRLSITIFYRAVAEKNNLPYLEADSFTIEQDLVKQLPVSLLKRKSIVPVTHNSNTMLVVSDPYERVSIDSIQRLIGQPLPLAMTDIKHLNLLIKRQLNRHGALEDTSTKAIDVDLVALLDEIIKEAFLNKASDIHFSTEEHGLRVRLRIDGKLRDYPVDADETVAAGLISRIKVLANLDIAEQRQPQDGGYSHKLAAPISCEFNVRVATAPTRLGERITLRLLGQQTGGITLADLGMLEDDLKRFQQQINKPYGMVLLTGPTGSGKSTTLCAALQEINQSDINIMTVENPIEYVIPGVSQLQTGLKISFADALRSLLRHDPDVLMVGEIRDHETADVSVKAAMTGHLVFSTLHTNNAVSAVTRLIDIGCEPFLIGSTMAAVIAQRLVRRLCDSCKQPRVATADELSQLDCDDQQLQIFEPVGCASCQGTGFKGRLGLFETLWFDESLARLVSQGCSEEALEQAAGENLKFMWQDGCQKVLLGITTLSEVRSVALVKTHQSIEVC